MLSHGQAGGSAKEQLSSAGISLVLFFFNSYITLEP